MKKNGKSFSRVWALLLTLLLCVSLLPMGVLANEQPGSDKNDKNSSEQTSEQGKSSDASSEDDKKGEDESKSDESKPDESKSDESKSDDGQSGEKQETEPCPPHDFKVVEKAAATCQKDGVNKHRECNKCHALYAIDEDKAVTAEELKIPASPDYHEWVEKSRIEPDDKNATDGSITYQCKVCLQERTEVLPAHPYYETAKTITLDDGNKLQCRRDASR